SALSSRRPLLDHQFFPASDMDQSLSSQNNPRSRSVSASLGAQSGLKRTRAPQGKRKQSRESLSYELPFKKLEVMAKTQKYLVPGRNVQFGGQVDSRIPIRDND